MDGIINVLKHAGVSSHDIVASIRKILKTKKVGHTGTLDPDAIGVLPICVGKATKLVEYITADKKTYRTELVFGYETDTQDSSGKLTSATELPQLDEESFKEILLNKFSGEIEQIPPMYSAIKKDGIPLYKLARMGETITLEPRKIFIYGIELLQFSKERALIEFTCSKGTYIRTLCQDIGRAVNSSAHMAFLLRTKSGQFHISDALTLTELENLQPENYLIKLSASLGNWPNICVKDDLLTRVLNGNKLPIELINAKLEPMLKYKVVDTEDNLLAISEVREGYLKPIKVFR